MGKPGAGKKKEVKKKAKLMERHNYFEDPAMMKQIKKQIGLNGSYATLSQFLRAAVRNFLNLN